MKEILKDYPNIKDLLKKVGITILLTGTIIGTGIGAYSIYHVVKSKEIFGEVLSKDFHVKFLNNIMSYDRPGVSLNSEVLIFSNSSKDRQLLYSLNINSTNTLDSRNFAYTDIQKGSINSDVSYCNVLKDSKTILNFNNKSDYSIETIKSANDFIKKSIIFEPNYSQAKFKTKTTKRDLNLDKNYIKVEVTFPNESQIELSVPTFNDSYLLNDLKLSYTIPANYNSDVDNVSSKDIINFYFSGKHDSEIIEISKIYRNYLRGNFSYESLSNDFYYCHVDAMWDAKSNI